MSQPNISKSGYVGGIGASIAATLVLVAMGVAEGGKKGAELVALGWIPVLVCAVLMGSLVYRMWAAIQDGYARTTPNKAVALLFVPIVNFFWAFRALPGFAEDYNRFLVRHDVTARPLRVGLFHAYVVLCVASFIPLLGVFCTLVNVGVGLTMVAAICDAINALGVHPVRRPTAFDSDFEAPAGGTARIAAPARSLAGSETFGTEVTAPAGDAKAEGVDAATTVSAGYSMAAELDTAAEHSAVHGTQVRVANDA